MSRADVAAINRAHVQGPASPLLFTSDAIVIELGVHGVDGTVVVHGEGIREGWQKGLRIEVKGRIRYGRIEARTWTWLTPEAQVPGQTNLEDFA